MSNMLQVSPTWTQNKHSIFNTKMNHDGEWKVYFNGSKQIYEQHYSWQYESFNSLDINLF